MNDQWNDFIAGRSTFRERGQNNDEIFPRPLDDDDMPCPSIWIHFDGEVEARKVIKLLKDIGVNIDSFSIPNR